VFVITLAGGLALLLHRFAAHAEPAPPRNRLWTLIRELLTLGLPAALGISYYVVQSFRNEWMADEASLLKWRPDSPLWMLKILGLPAILTLLLFFFHWRSSSPKVLLLRCWFLVAPVAIYTHAFNWAQHFLDGFHYATALLLVNEATDLGLVHWMRIRIPRLATAAAAAMVLTCIALHGIFRYQGYLDGRRKHAEILLSTVAPVDLRNAIGWLRRNAQSEQLVLAPLNSSAWYASVPMHSFASHAHFSITFQDQARLSAAFFQGRMPVEKAHALLNEYGVHYVVVPNTSTASRYLENMPVRATFQTLSIYELHGNEMKPYPGLKRLRGRARGRS
jgi:hypothetical protein